MICNQLMEVTNVLVKLNPQPSMLDITRTVCGCCDRIDSCPSLSVEHVERIGQKEGSANSEAKKPKRQG